MSIAAVAGVLLFYIELKLISIGLASPVIYGDNACDIISYFGTINQSDTIHFPYVVFLEVFIMNNDNISTTTTTKYQRSICTGIILEPDVILTAAHCIEISKKKVNEIIITAGIKDLQAEVHRRQYRHVGGYKVHKDFRTEMKTWYGSKLFHRNDIAILWLRNPLFLNSRIQKAQLPKEYISMKYRYGLCLGWGTNECGYLPAMLQKVQLSVITNKSCKKSLENIGIPDKVFCAMSDNRKCGVSTGDSGGPFIHNGIVYGLLSFGSAKYIKRDDGKIVPICDADFPSVFTNLNDFKSWIMESLKKGSPIKLCENYGKFCAI